MPKVLLVATVRDEGPNILEWVAYHRIIGFDRIQIYQNNSSDDSQKTLPTLAKIGAIEYFRNHCVKQQWQNKAYRRASFSEAYTSSDWCMALDGDDFLNVKIGNGMVGYLIDTCPDAEQILVNWRNFGSSGQLDLSDELVISRYCLVEIKTDTDISELHSAIVGLPIS